MHGESNEVYIKKIKCVPLLLVKREHSEFQRMVRTLHVGEANATKNVVNWVTKQLVKWKRRSVANL